MKTRIALKQSHYNEFYPSRAFKGLFRLRNDTSKVFFILNEYFNVYYIIIGLKDLFGAITRHKNSLHEKTVIFSSFAKIEPLKGLFGCEVSLAKLF